MSHVRGNNSGELGEEKVSKQTKTKQKEENWKEAVETG